jgi:DNA invertase Pin-like site-specific DNA recombinase
MMLGYARVSTLEQDLDLQTAALQRAACKRICFDVGVSGTVARRPALCKALKALRPGDVLATWRLDRLGRKPFASHNADH